MGRGITEVANPGDDAVVEHADANGVGGGPSIVSLEGSKLKARGHPFLHGVPPNIRVTDESAARPGKQNARMANGGGEGCFVGFDSGDGPKSHHVVPLGRLLGIRFMSLFRFKVWWTTHWVGDRGRDLEHETQMLILDKSPPTAGSSGRPYVLLLPIIEGSFRGCLQPGSREDYIDLCAESGSTVVTGSKFRSLLYVRAGDDPYDLVRAGMRAVRDHLGTFRLVEEKSPPPEIVDKFGWCTWDAFYLTVNPEGIWEGVQGLVEGGCPPGLVLIDDGWQSISHDDEEEQEEGINRTTAGEQMPCRLVGFQENHKFRDYQSPCGGKGLRAFVRDLKSEFRSVEQVYVWHALCGYWGGLRPRAAGLPESRVVKPRLSPGVGTTMEDLAVDKIVANGVGLVPPENAHLLYEGLHSHLAASGIDGVKVDVVELLEMVGEEYGGRVQLAKAYYSAITASIKKHFKGSGVIASMEHCNDFMLLGTEAISVGRVGDDFWCSDPQGVSGGTLWLQGCHMVHCAYNSLWMGNVVHPDWDMFQSTHPCARFHAASRAISGGPVYVSDAVGRHDFGLLRSLALPDGTILRCRSYALPTRDCLFRDPLHDGHTVLKIWNLNRFTGVLGLFNCQGGGWCRKERKNRSFPESSRTLTSKFTAADIEWAKGENNTILPVDGAVESALAFAIYFSEAKKLLLTTPDEVLEIALDPFHFELLTVSPIRLLQKKKSNGKVQFAPIGLVNMLNSGGAVEILDFSEEEDEERVRVGVRGTGEMRVFSSEEPRSVRINGQDATFKYDQKMVIVQVPWPQSSELSTMDYVF